MSLANTLTRLRQKAKASTYELAQASGVDYNHVRRLESGEARNSTRHTVIRLGQGLLDLSGDILLDDIDRLLKDANKGPLRRERIVIFGG